MSEYTTTDVHALIRDVRKAVKPDLDQAGLARKLLVSQSRIGQYEMEGHGNLELRTIAAVCRACGRVLKLRVISLGIGGDRVYDIGPFLGKVPLLKLAGLAGECGVTVKLRVEKL